MSRTIQDAFQEAVLKGRTNDIEVLTRYGVNFNDALGNFIREGHMDAAQAVMDMSGDIQIYQDQNILRHAIDRNMNQDAFSRLNALIAIGIKPSVETLKDAIGKNNSGAFDVIRRATQIDISSYNLKRDIGSFSLGENIALALIEDGIEIDTNSLNDFVRNGSLAVVERHLQAGIQPTANTVLETLYKKSTDLFNIVIAAVPAEKWSQKELEDMLGMSVLTHQLNAFEKLIEMGAKSLNLITFSEKAAKVLQGNPDEFLKANLAEDIISIYKTCCQIMGTTPDDALCVIPEPSQYPHARQILAAHQHCNPT